MNEKQEQKQSSYIIDIEMGAETARLVLQDKLFTQAMRGLFPLGLSLENVQDLLDIGCGPGGWVINMAYLHPEMTIVGIDTNQTMIEYATAQAVMRQFHTVSFELGDATSVVEMSGETFDCINARFVASFLTQET